MTEMADVRKQEPGTETPLLYALYLLLYLAVLIRMLVRPASDGLVGPVAYGLMSLFLVLGVIQVPLGKRWQGWNHVYLILQCLIVMALLLTRPAMDFNAILLVGLAIVAGRYVNAPWDIVWLVLLCVVAVIGLMLAFGPGGSVSYTPIYVASCLVVGMYGRAIRRTELARARSDELRAELEGANRRLRAYADQAEETAAAQERTRLARDLHDAATQTVFSMNLIAESARMALAQDPRRVPQLIDRLQELCREALGEMRALIRELRPPTLAEEGLVKALERYAATRGRRDGMRVALRVSGDDRCGPDTREVLYRAAVEALNNVARHSGVTEARLELVFGEREAILTVQDCGRGFDPEALRQPESFGLLSMRERAEARDGSVVVRSRPGQGTVVEVRLPLEGEGT